MESLCNVGIIFYQTIFTYYFVGFLAIINLFVFSGKRIIFELLSLTNIFQENVWDYVPTPALGIFTEKLGQKYTIKLQFSTQNVTNFQFVSDAGPPKTTITMYFGFKNRFFSLQCFPIFFRI